MLYFFLYQICSKLAGSATRVWNDEHKVPNLLSGDEWIGYDDEESLTNKVTEIDI